jgi:uncharacterized protein (DUF2336 family)
MTALAHSQMSQSSAEEHSLIDELVDVVATGSVKQRLRILQRVTDLFVAGSHSYSSEQIALFDDVLQELAADIEVKARAKLAHRLAGMNNAPPRIIRWLAFDDEIDVAGPVLVRSEQLNDDDLVENARTKSQAHLFAIAQRLKLSEAVTDVLVERGDRRVMRKVAGNGGARFSLAGYGRLTIHAQRDRKLTLTLGQRSDIPRQYFIKLLQAASASVRAKLEASNPQLAAAIHNSVDEVATAMQQEAREISQEYSAAKRDARRRFNVNPVAEVNVHAPARAQEFDKAVVSLAKLGHFPVDLVERALLDKGKDMLLILARAADCSWTTTRELLQMQAAGRHLTPDDLSLAFDRYKKLGQETARNIVKYHERRMKSLAEETTPDDKARAPETGKAASRPASEPAAASA